MNSILAWGKRAFYADVVVMDIRNLKYEWGNDFSFCNYYAMVISNLNRSAIMSLHGYRKDEGLRHFTFMKTWKNPAIQPLNVTNRDSKNHLNITIENPNSSVSS